MRKISNGRLHTVLPGCFVQRRLRQSSFGHLASSSRAIGQAILSDTLNPKVAISFVSFPPQFVDVRHRTLGFPAQLLILGISGNVMALAFASDVRWTMAKQMKSVKAVVRDPIAAYAQMLASGHAASCRKLRSAIIMAMPQATSKIWHESPVWFVGENPVVAHSVKAGAISLLFWNGQSWGEAGLTPVGKFRAAEKVQHGVAD